MRPKKTKEQQKYFQKALSEFTFDMASGGAIRHLADRGYTAHQIWKKLDFPTPYERVRQTLWEYFLTEGILRLEEPGVGVGQEKYEYVTDYDAFGRKSFRRVLLEERGAESVSWTERRIAPGEKRTLGQYLEKACGENGEEFSYVSCDFGLMSRRDPETYAKRLGMLEPQLREYVEGLPWERRMVWHRLDKRMREIILCLYENGAYRGACYFLKTEEKLLLEDGIRR